MQVRSGLVRRLIAGLLLAAALLVVAFLVMGKTTTGAPLNRIHLIITLTITLGPGRDASQTGTATLTGGGARPTEVVIEIQPGPPGVEQPAYIHTGTCPDVGEVAYLLNSVVDGTSTSTIDATLSSLEDGDFAISVHKSEAEIGVYVSCGDIRYEEHTIEIGPPSTAPYTGPREVYVDYGAPAATPPPTPSPTIAPTPEPTVVPTAEPTPTPVPTPAGGNPADDDGVSPFWFVLAGVAGALVLVGGGTYFVWRYRR